MKEYVKLNSFVYKILTFYCVIFSHFLQQNMPPAVPPQIVNQSKMTTRDCPKGVTSSQHTIRNYSFKAKKLDIGATYDIEISHVEDGPLKFSVQLVQDLTQIDCMMKKINSQHHIHLQEPPIAGVVGLAKRKTTNQLYRVVLNSPGDTECKVSIL